MAADLKVKYPQASGDTVPLTITLASLASDSSLLAGRAGTAESNLSKLDADHLLSGVITTGTSPTAGGVIEVWVYAPRKIVSGAPTYPDGITGSDANKSMTSAEVLQFGLRLVARLVVTNASNRAYDIGCTSIASLFGNMPEFWGAFVVHSTGVALNSTGGNHELHYARIQGQSV